MPSYALRFPVRIWILSIYASGSGFYQSHPDYPVDPRPAPDFINTRFFLEHSVLHEEIRFTDFG